ncbi:MAG: DNA adenine methylase [Nitrososphaerota archaeon]
MSKRVSPLINYMGGKFHIAKHIISLFDYSLPTYIELFAGGANVLWQKKPHKIEILNDKDGDLINLYKVVKAEPKRFFRELYYMPFSRQLYYEIWEDWENGNKGKDDFERAVRYFYILRLSYSGKIERGLAFSLQRSKSETLRHILKNLKFYSDRLANVMIENRDFREILDDVIRLKVKSVIYADPPYCGIKNYYKTDFALQDHIDLAERLNALKDRCQIVLSYYDCELIEKYYSEKQGWKIKKVLTAKHSTKQINGSKRPLAEELIIFNYSDNTYLPLLNKEDDNELINHFKEDKNEKEDRKASGI